MKNLSLSSLFFVLLSMSVFADPGLIQLTKGTIDPDAPRVSAAASSVSTFSNEGTCLYVVQPEKNFTASEKWAVKKLGIRFQGNIPPNAYLLEMRPEQRSMLEEQFKILYCEEFQPEYKLLYTGSPSDEPQIAGAAAEHYVLIGAVRKAYLDDIKEAAAFLGINDIEEVSNTLSPCIKCHLTDNQASELAKRGDVAFIEPYSEPKVFNDVARGSRGVNLTDLHMEGYTGKGEKICIQDSGLDNGKKNKIHPDFQGKNIKGAVTKSASVYRSKKYRKSFADFNDHGTHVSGSALGTGSASSGTYRGMAKDADVYMLCAGTSYGDGYIFSGSLKELLKTYKAGCRVMNNSWGGGTSGYYGDDARLYDTLVWKNKDYTVLFAAGNANSYYDRDLPPVCTLSNQGSAKNVITVGAAESYRPGVDEDCYPEDGRHQGMAYFSSRGPCWDGRIKPDIVAPGTYIWSCQASPLAKSSSRSDYYRYMSGTSMATPISSGCAAVVRDYLKKNKGIKSPSAALVKCVLCVGARSLYPGQYTSFREIPTTRPNAVEGHGHINMKESLEPDNLKIVESQLKKTGATYETSFEVTISTIVKIGLCWTDYPGTAGAYNVLVNDLDLTVIAPNGTRYTLNDHQNNLEVIRLTDQIPSGTYRVVVNAKNIMEGPQPFAIVISYDQQRARRR